MGRTKTVNRPPEPSEATEARAFEGFVSKLYALRPRPLLSPRRLWLMGRYALFVASGPASESKDRLAVAVAVMRADDRLFAEHGVRICCSRGALLRLVEMANPPGRPRVSPDAVVGRRVRARARRLVAFHGKARRGDVLRVEERPGGRVRIAVVRRGSG